MAEGHGRGIVSLASHVHVYRPGHRPDAPTLLMLHGTGGDEHDLLTLAEALDPTAAVLSPRGNVLEHGMPRFFRRLAEGVFDVDDLKQRAEVLAEWIIAARAQYGVARERLVAVGFSNGANIAAAVLLLRPDVLRAAALLCPMVPLEPVAPPALAGARVLLAGGLQDPMATPTGVRRLGSLLESGGATVEVALAPGGHGISEAMLAATRRWLRGVT